MAQAERAGWGAVVMAAGAGRRMGGLPKALLRRDGEPLLLRQIRLLAEAGVGPIAVALGHHAPRLAQVLAQAGADELPGTAHLRWAVNPAPDTGPGSTLRCGLALLPAQVTPVLVLLGDQPLVQARDVLDVLRVWEQRPDGIDLIVPTHQGQPGHPVAFGAAVRAAVLCGSGGQGVREWRRAHGDRVHLLDCSHARCTTDVDTHEDVQRLAREQGVALEVPRSTPG